VAVKSYGSSKASITKTANGFNTATNSHNTAAERERVVLPPNCDSYAIPIRAKRATACRGGALRSPLARIASDGVLVSH
jgi:hypothetical protein